MSYLNGYTILCYIMFAHLSAALSSCMKTISSYTVFENNPTMGAYTFYLCVHKTTNALSCIMHNLPWPPFRLTIQPTCPWRPVPASFGRLSSACQLWSTVDWDHLMALCDVSANVNVVLLLCVGFIGLCVQIV